MNYTKPFRLSRRHVLKGVGAAMSLPLLEAMSGAAPSALAVGPDGQSIRFAGLFVPNGINHKLFTPEGSKLSGELPPILEPLAEMTDHFNVITGLNNAGNGHAAGTAAWLTGSSPKKSARVSDINVNNPSLDQIIGKASASSHVQPTLELGMHAPKSGISNSGHSQIYTSFISWKNATTPVPFEVNPMRAFDRLFKNASVSAKRSESNFTVNKSILDTVLEDAKQLQRRLGRNDSQKLDEYLTTVREVESRIFNRAEASEMLSITPEIYKEIGKTKREVRRAMKDNDGLSRLPKIDYPEYVQIMMDIMALAMWSNSTRATTLMLGDGFHSRNMSFLDGVNGNHHSISHHGNKEDALNVFAKINTYYMSQYNYFLNRLHTMKEGGSSVLENSIVMMGTNLSNGQGHSGRNVFMLLGGNGGGQLKGGRHIKAGGQKIARVHRSVLDMMNIEDQSIGGSGLKGLG